MVRHGDGGGLPNPWAAVARRGGRPLVAVPLVVVLALALTYGLTRVFAHPAGHRDAAGSSGGHCPPSCTPDAAEPTPASSPTSARPSPSATPTPTPSAVATTGRARQPSPTARAAAPALAAAFDNAGTSDDNRRDAGNLDGDGNSFSAQALADEDVRPGGTVVAHGVRFTWPAAGPGSPDNALAHGQTVAPGGGSGGRLSFLPAGSHGSPRGTGRILYTDGTQQDYTITAPDWDTGDGDSVIDMRYRNRPDGSQYDGVHLFYDDVSLAPGRTVAAVILPQVSTTAANRTPAMHIFALALG